MSIWSSMFTSSSGIRAYGEAMGVVGDNVANVGTTGFKGSRAGFAALLGGIGSNQQRVGAGVSMSGAEVNFGQGSLQQTGRAADAAVWGKGFFVMSGNHQGVEGQYFTRDGRMALQDGFLVGPTGLRLQGYAWDAGRSEMSGALGDIQIDETTPPAATSSVDIRAQLDDTLEGEPPMPAEHESSITIYDDSGRAHTVNIIFTSDGQGSDRWSWRAEVDGGETLNGISGTPEELGSGVLDSNSGQMTGSINVNWRGSNAGQTVNFDFSNSTQYPTGFDLSYDADGHAAGSLNDFRLSEEGVVLAKYSNGEELEVGRVALATFGAENGLERTGSQLFRVSPESGEAAIGMAATNGRGSIKSGVIEGSNVDLGTELVTMITYQRAFQANARTVTTSDEMLQETANLKR